MSKITIVRMHNANGSNPIERVMSAVGQHDLELADELHESDVIRPYSTCIAPNGALDVIAFDDRIGQALLRAGGRMVTRVDPSEMRPDESPGRVIRLAFETPTHFRVAGLEYMIPDPFHVFGSTIERWNALGYPPLPYPNLKRVAVIPEKIFFQRHPAHGGHEQRGFVGVVRFDILPLSEDHQAAMWALSRFAEYRGIGKHTTYGMGRVRVLDEFEQWEYQRQVACWHERLQEVA